MKARTLHCGSRYEFSLDDSLEQKNAPKAALMQHARQVCRSSTVESIDWKTGGEVGIG